MACTGTKDRAGQDATVSVKDGMMTPEVLLSFGRLSDPQISPDGAKIIYNVGYQDLKGNKSSRSLYICNTDGSGRKLLARGISGARWSADGNTLWFIKGGQIWKAPISGNKLGKQVKVSEVPAGVSEFKLSPDESQIMYLSTIPGPVKQAKDSDPALDKATAYVAEDLMYRHWDHWVTETPRTFVATTGNGTITPDNSIDILGSEPYELPTEPFGGLEQLSWHPDSRHIAYACRKKTGIEYAFSTDTEIYIYDILTGGCQSIPMGGGYDTDPAWSPDGSRLAWISMERDGYEADRQRLMVASFTTDAAGDGQSSGLALGEIRELTAGFKYDVAGFTWTEDGSNIIFSSTMDAVGAICKVGTGDAVLTRLTPGDWWYGFGTPFSVKEKDGTLTMLTTWQSMEFPTELVRVEIPTGEAVPSFTPVTKENAEILSQIDGIQMDRITLKASSGEDLSCWVLYPPHFDEKGSWPGIEMFNGGPQTSLDQSWSYRWNFRLMAQQGYVVILPNRHGDSGFGQAWKEQISGDYQGLNMDDYQTAGKWFKAQPWAGKLAGVGASYGGFSVYNMMGIHGDLYDCFISHAGIFDEKMMWYTTEEAWFGNWDNGGLQTYAFEAGKTGPEGDGITFGGMQQAGAPYANVAKSKFHYANAPESKVTRWHTPILCIHGGMDFRIPYEQGMAAFNAARMMGVPAKLVVFPDECHWILKPQNALFWHRTFFDWLAQWTKE